MAGNAQENQSLHFYKQKETIPHGLNLGKEIREIGEAIRGAIKRDLFEIQIRTAVRPEDIRRAFALCIKYLTQVLSKLQRLIF